MSKPERTNRSDPPSLLHASSVNFPDLPRREGGGSGKSEGSASSSHSEPSGPMAFFQKLKKGVETGLRPVPGLLKMSRASTEGDEPHSHSSQLPSSPPHPIALPLPPAQSHQPAPATSSAASPVPPMSHAAQAAAFGHAVGHSPLSPPSLPTPSGQSSAPKISPYRLGQFEKLLSNDNIDIAQLRLLAWNGIPDHMRCQIWQMLLNYMSVNKDRRENIQNKKRDEYFQSLVPLYNNLVATINASLSVPYSHLESQVDRSTMEGEILRQILVDIPRTATNIPLFSTPLMRHMLERVLYIFAIRHPACGYVQGMNDLLVPIVIVTLQGYLLAYQQARNPSDMSEVRALMNALSCASNASAVSPRQAKKTATVVAEDPLTCDVAQLPKALLEQIETDCYWCFTKLLDSIQDHYIFGQPGLQRMIYKLEDLVLRLDPPLHRHLKDTHNILFIQFAFRWMNCLLIRELPLHCIIRLYDTYFSQEYINFIDLHVYVCCVILTMFREELLARDFQDILTLLQNLPTNHWTHVEMESILAQAYILSHLFDHSPSHLNNNLSNEP